MTKYKLSDLQDPEWWRKHQAALNRSASTDRDKRLADKVSRTAKAHNKQQQQIKRTQNIDVSRLQDKFERAAAQAVLGGETPQEQSKAFRRLQSDLSRDIKHTQKTLNSASDDFEKDNLKRRLNDLKQLQREMKRTAKDRNGETVRVPFNTRINAAVTYATEYKGAGMELLQKTQGFTKSHMSMVVGQSEIYDRFYNFYLSDQSDLSAFSTTYGAVMSDMDSLRLEELYEQLNDAARRYDSDEFGRIARLITHTRDEIATRRLSYHQQREGM